MRKLVVFLMIPLLASCFLMPLGAPHRYEYVAVNNGEIKSVFVFCTPRIKTLHFSAKEGQEIDVKSKIFSTSEEKKLEYKDFFVQNEYQLSIRISDRKYHKIHEQDTIRLFSKSANTEQLFVLKKDNNHNITK